MGFLGLEKFYKMTVESLFCVCVCVRFDYDDESGISREKERVFASCVCKKLFYERGEKWQLGGFGFSVCLFLLVGSVVSTVFLLQTKTLSLFFILANQNTTQK